MFCPQCGNENDITAKFCSVCWSALRGLQNPVQSSALAQVALNTPSSRTEVNAQGNSEELYKAIIGQKKQVYYLNHFSRFDRNGTAGASWHWPAFFVTFCWFLYRKMWLAALLYFILPFLLSILPRIIVPIVGISHGTNMVIGAVFILYLLCILLLPAIYANAIYYNHCKKKILKANESSHGFQRQIEELAGKGGTSSVAPIFALVFTVIILTLSIIFWLK